MTSQRVLRRFLVGVVLLAALIYGFKFFQSLGGRLDDALPANTQDLIAAVQYEKEGQAAVAIKPDGTVVKNAGYKEGVTDRELTWNPSGNRIFFVSDRKQDAFHIYIWNPVTNAEPGQRTVDTSGRGNPSFDVQGGPDADKSMLITSRGFVQEFRPVDSSTPQVLPPPKRGISQADTGEGQGTVGSFEQAYKQLGSSFRVAKWLKNKNYIAAVMRRDQGEILVVQNLAKNDEGKAPPPIPVIAGERIDIAVDPKSGSLVYTVLEFMYPDVENLPKELIKDGKIQKPFQHCVGVFDPDAPKDQEKTGVIIASVDDKMAFNQVAVAPDGATLIAVVGPYAGNGSVTSKELISMPLRAGGGQSASPLVEGEIYEPAWHPLGTKIAYVKKEGGKRSIFVANSDGSMAKNLTGDKGEFGKPIFSPQSK